MPTMANITVKKNDGTTDQVWTAAAPSAGNGAPAIWRNESVGSTQGLNPEARLTVRDGADGQSRRGRATISWPQLVTDSTTGVTSIGKVNKVTVDWDLKHGMPTVDANEFASQAANLLASTLFKDSIKARFAPT